VKLSIGNTLLIINKCFLSIVIILNYFLVVNNSYSEEIEIINPITVTGYHYPKKLTETGSAVTVITNEEIEQSGMQYVSQVLSATAGFQAYKSGGPQSLTRAFLRGNETDHTLVLINGMKIVDSSTGRGSVDLERLKVTGVERIEVLRGSQSAIYGSEAIGGVINIILKRGTIKPVKYLNIEASNRLDKDISTGFSGNIEDLYFAVNYNHSEGPGISAAEKSLGYHENDSYDIDSANLVLDYDLNTSTELSLITRVFTSENEEDDAPSGPFLDADRNSNLLDWQSALSLYKKYELFSVDASIETARARRYQLKNARKFRWYIADLNVGRLKFNIPLNTKENFIFGVETERAHMDTQDQYNAYDFKVSSSSSFYSYSNNTIKNLFIDGSFRSNHHDLFGLSTTYRVAASYIIPDSGFRLHSSYGTGYRAPTLDELFGSYGSINVKEETSRSRDIGIEYSSFKKNFVTDLTFFSTQIDDLIGYGPAPGYKFKNIGSAQNNGIEIFMKYIPNNNININSHYNFLTTNNNGRSLSRRKKHSGKTSINWVPEDLNMLSINSIAEYHSNARDGAFAGGHIAGYALFHSNINYTFDVNTKVQFKIENVLDQNYSEADTAGTYGRTLSLSLKLTF
jgi:vitamin B12 transporter